MDGRAGVRPKVPATICWHQPTCTVRRYDRHTYIFVIILHYRVDILHLIIKVCHMNERRVLERGPLTFNRNHFTCTHISCVFVCGVGGGQSTVL